MPDNNRYEYDIFQYADSVSVLLTNEENHILLIKQFRPGPEKIIYELPGGTVEPELTPLANAKKELFEETGYKAKNYKLLNTFYKDAYSENVHYLYECNTPEFVEHRNGDETEWIESGFYTLKQVETFHKAGKLEATLGLLLTGKHFLK